MDLVVRRLFAAALGVALLFVLSLYPAHRLLPALALLAYCTLLWVRPTCWLLLVPALLPLLDFSPWTGWFYLDELDLMLLATAAGKSVV